MQQADRERHASRHADRDGDGHYIIETRGSLAKLVSLSELSDLTDISEALRITSDTLLLMRMWRDECIIQCSFDRWHSPGVIFKEFIRNNYGVCYTFNTQIVNGSRDALNTSLSGSQYGLRLRWIYRLGLFALKYGSHVIIHAPDVHTDPTKDGFHAAPRAITAVSLRKKIIIRSTA